MKTTEPLMIIFSDAFGGTCFTGYCYNLNQISGAVQEGSHLDAIKISSIGVGKNGICAQEDVSIIVGPTGKEQTQIINQVIGQAASLNWPLSYLPSTASGKSKNEVDQLLSNLGLNIGIGLAAQISIKIGEKAIKMILRRLRGVADPSVVQDNDPVPPYSAGSIVEEVPDPDPEGLPPDPLEPEPIPDPDPMPEPEPEPMPEPEPDPDPFPDGIPDLLDKPKA